MTKNLEKISKINKDLGNLSGNENENFIKPQNEDEDIEEADNIEEVDNMIERTKMAFNRGDGNISDNYLSPEEILREYNSFDE